VLDGRVSYISATRAPRQQLVGKKFFFQTPGAFGNSTKSIVISDVNLTDGGDKVVLKLALMGDIIGDVFLTGTPMYQSGNTQAIAIPNLDYSVETKQVLPRVADWLLHGQLVSSLRALAVLPLDEKLGDVQRRVSAALNRQLAPGIGLSGAVDAVSLRGVYLTPSELIVRAVADGKTSLAIAFGR
jgi:hypothetical protein